MLVLSRKAFEKILIGTDITITIVRINGNEVRIGVEAPRNIGVVRYELIIPDDDEVLTSN